MRSRLLNDKMESLFSGNPQFDNKNTFEPDWIGGELKVKRHILQSLNKATSKIILISKSKISLKPRLHEQFLCDNFMWQIHLIVSIAQQIIWLLTIRS